MKIHLIMPCAQILALCSLAIIFVGRFWWPGEASSWAGSARFALMFFLIAYLFSGEIGKGFKSKSLLAAVGLLFSWVVLNFLLLDGDPSVLRRSLVLMVFLCAVVVLKESRADWLCQLLMVLVVVATVAALLTFVYQFRKTGFDFQYRAFRLSDSGVTGFAQFGNPIISGLYMAFAGLVALWCVLRTNKSWVKFGWLFCLLVISFYVFLTFARTAWLAMVLGGVVLFVIQAKRDIFLLVICALFALLVCLIFWRFPEILSVEIERGATGRHLIWSMVLSSMSGYWWLGHGAGSSMQPMSIPGQQVVNTHSLYLEVLFQYGIIGLGLFVSTLFLALRQLWLERSEMAILGLCLLVGCIGVMFFDLYSFIHSPNLVWLWVWFPLGLALACSKDGVR